MNVSQQTRAMQRLAEGTHSVEGEKLDWTYYDRLVLAAAGTSFQLFQVPLGAAGKTLADTNFTTNGVIPVNQNMRVRAIVVNYAQHADLASASIALLYAFIRDTTISLVINGKAPTFQKPLSELLGVSLLAHTTPAATFNDVVQATGRFTGITPLNVPITLAAQSNFEVRIEYPTALGAIAIVGDFLKIGLNGILLRAS